MTVLDQLRTILIELGDLKVCAALYQEAFDHYQQTFPLGHEFTEEDSHLPSFRMLEVLVLADLYNIIGEHDKAINSIRKGCRWLQGRVEQTFWDRCIDDREYDLPSEEGGAVRASTTEGDTVEPGMYPIDINARHRLAVARIKLGDIQEAQVGIFSLRQQYGFYE